jgi:hypothetical protein
MGVQGTAAMHDSSVDESTFQLIMDQLEELVVTVIEEIRERPGVALAIAAGVIGAIVGVRAAARLGRRSAPPAPLRAAHKAKRVGEMAELAGLGLRLMQNPIVRGLVIAAIERQVKRRFSI